MRLSARRRAALLAAGALAAAGVTVPVGAAYAATSCDVVYATNDWPGGFTANVTIRNLGDPIDGWILGFDFAAGQRVTQGWSATWSQSGAHVTATNMPWNGAIPSGGQTSVGFNGSWTGSNPKPTSFTINGVTCGGAPQPVPPTVDLTVPAGPFEAPGDVPLSATAADSDGTVTKVEFYRNGMLVNTDTSAPYAYLLEDLPAGSYTVQARAYDNATDRHDQPRSPSPRPPARWWSRPRPRSRSGWLVATVSQLSARRRPLAVTVARSGDRRHGRASTATSPGQWEHRRAAHGPRRRGRRNRRRFQRRSPRPPPLRADRLAATESTRLPTGDNAYVDVSSSIRQAQELGLLLVDGVPYHSIET